MEPRLENSGRRGEGDLAVRLSVKFGNLQLFLSLDKYSYSSSMLCTPVPADRWANMPKYYASTVVDRQRLRLADIHAMTRGDCCLFLAGFSERAPRSP